MAYHRCQRIISSHHEHPGHVDSNDEHHASVRVTSFPHSTIHIFPAPLITLLLVNSSEWMKARKQIHRTETPIPGMLNGTHSLGDIRLSCRRSDRATFGEHTRSNTREVWLWHDDAHGCNG